MEIHRRTAGATYSRDERLWIDAERRCPGVRAREEFKAAGRIRPRGQPQQEPDKKCNERRRAGFGNARRLMIDDLARNTGAMFGCGRVMMEQAEAVQRDEAHQRELDDPDPRVKLPAMCALGHASIDRPTRLADSQDGAGPQSLSRCCTKAPGIATRIRERNKAGGRSSEPPPLRREIRLKSRKRGCNTPVSRPGVGSRSCRSRRPHNLEPSAPA